MKKIKTKILIGFGATTTLLTASSIVLSCGNSNQESKLNTVTADIIIIYVKTQKDFTPSVTTGVPLVAPRSVFNDVTLNGLSGLTIIISNWEPDFTLGSVTFDVSISKTGLTTKTIKEITYGGWYSDQKRLNVVTAEMVSIYVKGQVGFTPSPTTNVPTIAPSNTLTNATLNDVSKLTMTILNWVSDSTNGSVTFDVSISRADLTAKSITGVTYDGWPTNPNQQKLNVVIAQDVADYVKTQTGFIPSVTEDAPAIASKSAFDNVTLNGVDGLTILISNWVQDLSLGSVTFDVSISKFGLATVDITGVTYDGWKTDQDRLNVVTTTMVADYVKTQIGFIPSVTTAAPIIVPHSTLTNAKLDVIEGLTITISNWKSDDITGSVTFDASISRSDLATPKSITGVTYDGWAIIITKTNAATTEGKLWSWDDKNNTLTINTKVTIIRTTDSQPIVWGTHDITTIASINFPNTLIEIDDAAFGTTSSTHLKSLSFPASLSYVGDNAFSKLADPTTLQFLGAIPGTSRILSLGSGAFLNLATTSIIAGDSGTTAIQWQDWAKNGYPSAFKK